MSEIGSLTHHILMISSLINQFRMHPRRIFLFDGLGAIVTMFFLSVVLVRLNDLVGIPISTLKILASLPIAFLLIDVIGYIFYNRAGRILLRLIVLLNLTYCAVSLYFGWLDVDSITWLGWTYLVIEILIILGVVLVERGVLREMQNA